MEVPMLAQQLKAIRSQMDQVVRALPRTTEFVDNNIRMRELEKIHHLISFQLADKCVHSWKAYTYGDYIIGDECTICGYRTLTLTVKWCGDNVE